MTPERKKIMVDNGHCPRCADKNKDVKLNRGLVINNYGRSANGTMHILSVGVIQSCMKCPACGYSRA
jgi:C4-type Zn-finger protein